MNSLAVRVSSILSSENSKKNSEIRASLMNLPSTRIFSENLPNAEANKCLSQFIDEFTMASTVDKQLSLVKMLSKKFTQKDPWILTDKELCQMLSDLYFHAPLKHPIRNTVVKVLHKTIEKRAIVIESAYNTIATANESTSKLLNDENTRLNTVNDFVASLIGSFENFDEATAAVEKCFPELLNTINRIICLYLTKLHPNNALSPGKRSQIYIYLHNSIRVVISCLQPFQPKIIASEDLVSILTNCWSQMISNASFVDLPMDTKVNCGMIKVCCDRIFGDIYAPREHILKHLQMEDDTPDDYIQSIREICYCVAVVNTITEKDFADSNFDAAFRVVVNRLIVAGHAQTMDTSIAMAVARALVQVSKKLLILLRKLTILPSKTLIEISENCLHFVWLNIDHSIDCVRYLAKDLLKNLLKLGHEHSKWFGSLIDESLKIAKSPKTNEMVVCLLLDYLCQVLGTQSVLIEVADIQKRILANIFGDGCWSTCYERLMIADVGIEIDVWCQRWIDPLLSVDEREWQKNFDRLKIIRNLFERALKSKPDAAEFILGKEKISLEIYLFVLWTMRRSGRKAYAPGNWQPSSDAKVVYAKMHPSDEIRILAFRILIECHKTCEQFPMSDLNEILEFVRFNCNCQSPSIRHQINTTMKRALTRIECGFFALKNQTNENEGIRNDYRRFIVDLVSFCVEWCLFSGANFSRRTIGLTTLSYAIETWRKLFPTEKTIFTRRLYERLQRTLADSYTSNKELTNRILRLSHDQFDEDDKPLTYTLSSLRSLVVSVRPDDSMTAAFYLEYCEFSRTHFTTLFDIILWCEQILNDGLTAAEHSLVNALRCNSLYGALLCLRHLLQQIELKSITDEHQMDVWRGFFNRIAPKCKRLTDVVAPIVNSAAPEGHLPNDLNDVSTYIPAAIESTEVQAIKVTSQVILVCAWRTVREASLLLGDIALRTPIIPEEATPTATGMISVPQMLRIGAHFQQLLAETKHRGAFEQAYVGFSRLCVRLWRSNEPSLHSMPMKWLRKIAAIISGELFEDDDSNLDITKLCFTRRSAGIPFMVQAIVASQVEVCSTSALTYSMQTFIEIARNGERADSRTHALNILRALFRCTELGEAVSEYVSDGLECSIRGYSAHTWPERNSSTLLFASLMTRTFGVQRDRENLSIKNKMTGRLFFIRYPRLYDFFLTELSNAAAAINCNARPPRLHPLLLLISRLYPSALEGSESNLKLDNFVPLISGCSSSPELVTRELSAKSMVALIPPLKIIDRLNDICVELAQQTKSTNAVHGFLLQILHLIRVGIKYVENDKLVEFVIKLLEIELHYNSITSRTFLEILIEIIVSCQIISSNTSIVAKLNGIYAKYLTNINDGSTFNRLTESYIRKAFTIFELILSQSKEYSTTEIQRETIITQLNILHLILLKSNDLPLPKQEFIKIEIDFADFVIRYDDVERVLKSLPKFIDLKTSQYLRNELHPFGTIKAFEIMSIMLKTPDTFHIRNELQHFTSIELLALMNEAADDDEIDEIAVAKWKFVNSVLIHFDVGKFTKNEMNEILRNLRQISSPCKRSDLRQAAAETTSFICKYFACSSGDIKQLLNFIELLLTLLRDDNVFVRNRASDIVLLLTQANHENVIPLVAEDYLLRWLNTVFTHSECSNIECWIDLIRLIHESAALDNDSDSESDDDEANDVDLFEANEINIFGETLYVSFKCYLQLIESIGQSSMSESEKSLLRKQIDDEFPNLKNF